MAEYYTNDKTWCSNKDCKHKSCEKHQSHMRVIDVLGYISISDLENTKYCEKEKGRE